jgi:hypothetical protein
MNRRRTMTSKPAKAQHSSTTKPRRTSELSSLGGTAVAQPTSPMPTGNGFGYAVVHPKSGALIGFFAHPYRFMRPPANFEDKAPETANFIGEAAWQSPSVQRVSYVQQSHIIQVIDGKSTAHFFMPFILQRNVLVAASDAVDPCLAVTWNSKVHVHPEKVVGNLHIQVVRFKKFRERIVVVPLAGGKNTSATKFRGPAFAFMSVENDGQIQAAVSDFQNWWQGENAKALIDRELRALENWRVRPAVTFSSPEARDLWRQSETVLRMGQIRERDRRAFGLINASLTGEFLIPWVRDMSYAVVALTKMGHREEAKAGLNAYYNAGPIGTLQAEARVPYQISLTRYFGDGSEETDYDNSDPTKQNIEFDDWGLALWATGEYFAEYRDMAWLNTPAAHGTVYETARDYVVNPLVANLEPIGGDGGRIFRADTSCWEQNSIARQHYAFSNITAIGGLKAFLPIAEAMGDGRTAAEIQKTIQQMRTGFQTAFVHGDEVRGTKEPGGRNAMDGALLEGINFGVITNAKQIQSTLSRMGELKTPSGGYRRVLLVRGSKEKEYEAQEFLLINFNLARAYIRLGDPKAGDALVQRMQQNAAGDNNLIPELYVSKPTDDFPRPIGAPTGSRPMVGYGAGSYILYLMERQRGVVDSSIA